MARLLERDEELRALAALARRVGPDPGRVVLMRGEAGVGKTAVISELVAGADPAVRVLQGWCDPLATPRPLGPLIDALAGLDRRVADGLVGALEAGDTGGVYRRLLEVLRSGPRWLWVVEDMHWADGATLDLLRFLGRRISGLPLLLVMTYRDDEVGTRHPLAAAIGDVATSAAITRIGLAPLSRDAVAELAAGSGLNATDLHRLTGGNPFYVTEILGAGPDRDGLPHSVGEAVLGRLARLPDAARDTAHAVAVCGPRASLALVRAICPQADDGVDECLRAGVLVTEDGVLGFRHELARRATLDQIPDHERLMLHRGAVDVLSQTPVERDSLAALTFHAEARTYRARRAEGALDRGPRVRALPVRRRRYLGIAMASGHRDAPRDGGPPWRGRGSGSPLASAVDVAGPLRRGNRGRAIVAGITRRTRSHQTIGAIIGECGRPQCGVL
jgi:predicted ATPase